MVENAPKLMLLTYQFLSERKNILSNICLLIVIISMFAILINDNELMQEVAPDIICIFITIILHSAFYHSFYREWADGVIEQILLQPIIIELFLIRKILVTSLFYQISIILVMPFLSVLTNMSSLASYKLMLSTLCSTPAIITLSLLGSALSISDNHNNTTMSIIILPLLIPVLILSSSVAHSSEMYTELLSLFILTILTIPINVIAISYLLKESVQNH